MKTATPFSTVLLLAFAIVAACATHTIGAAPEPLAESQRDSIKRPTRQDFANPAQHYWPRPLWFWNNTRVSAETVQDQMLQARDRCKYGGFGILPFGKRFGPAYLSEDYFAIYGVALAQAKALGLTLSLYDEYGFPSGSAGSQNSSDTSLFAQRWPDLTIKRLDKQEWEIAGPARFQTNLPSGKLAALVAMNVKTLERFELSDTVRAGRLDWMAPAGSWKVMAFVCVKDGDPICDYLDPEAADRFIELTHQAYYNRFPAHFGTTIDTTFFDEPTLYRASGRTWTDKFNEKFSARHGFDPRPYYPALWYDIGPDTQAARNYLFGFRAELYATGFTKRIQDWCNAHRITATGHQDQEEVVNPVSVSGDLMKCFQHLDIPGIDKIGGDRPAERFYKVVSSAAYNWDKSLVMSETYGAMGDLSWDAIYTVAMEQYTKGINQLIPHAVWYDNTNVTFKPELSWRHPRYAERLPEFNTYLARLNVLLQNDAAHVADIAVLYPIATLQGSHHLDGALGFYKGGVAVPEADYVDVGELLAVELGRDYTFLHPEVLDGNCSIDDGRLVLPNRVHPGRFSILILPGHKTIHWSSLRKIQAFYDQGGSVIATRQLPFQSAEFGHDNDVVRAVTALFGATNSAAAATAPFEIRRNDRGGCAIRLRTLNADVLREALDAARPDFDVTFAPGTAFRYIHKNWDGRHVFFFANLNPKLAENVVTLRGRHALEAWDPHAGTVGPAQFQHIVRKGIDFTQVQLKLPYLKSVFLISAPDPAKPSKTGLETNHPETAAVGFAVPMPPNFQVRPLPGHTSVVFTIYGAPAELEPLKQLVQVMRDQSLGNGFDPGPTPHPNTKPVFEYLAELGWPVICYPGCADMQIKGGRCVLGRENDAALIAMDRAGVFTAVQLGEWGYYFHNLSHNQSWWRDVYGKDFDAFKHLMKPPGLAGYDRRPTNRRECYDALKDYFTSRSRDLLGRVISVTGHSHYEAYAGEWGARCIGLEVGENIAFTQSKFAFARGASRQWQLPWAVQVSPWFSGACTTSGPLRKEVSGARGLDAGHSLSFYERMWLHAWFAGAAMVTPENSIAIFFEKASAPWTLTAHGRKAAEVFQFMQAHDRGVPFTPVAVVLDHLAGYNGYMDKPWGILEPTAGDRQLRDLFDYQLFPGSDHIHHRPDPDNPESSYLRPTPYGEMFDVQLTSASAEMLSSYPAILLAGDIEFDEALLAKLEHALKQGSTLLLAPAHQAALGPRFARLARHRGAEVLQPWTNPATSRPSAISGLRLERLARETLPVEVSGTHPSSIRSIVRPKAG